MLPESHLSAFQKKLLAWYGQNARALPWRKTQDPYKIWVSEIMLQQTQVATVIPYYKKWARRFPTLTALARAGRDDVIKFWAGLGYYRRARALHDAAQYIVLEKGGIIPKTVQELMKFPGVGRYTAGAIASIAFGERVPVLDGNVIRVLTRLLAVSHDIARPATIQKLWEIAEAILPEKKTGNFNQALMELGATCCLPVSPQCGRCPVQKFCRAYTVKRQTDFPVKKQKERTEKIKNAALVLRRNEKVLLQKQPENGRWGGLWMFPVWKDKKTMLLDMKREGLQCPAPLTRMMTLHHGFTKYRIRLDVYEGLLKINRTGKILPRYFPISGGSRPKLSCTRWIPVSRLPGYAFPSAHRKIAAKLRPGCVTCRGPAKQRGRF